MGSWAAVGLALARGLCNAPERRAAMSRTKGQATSREDRVDQLIESLLVSKSLYDASQKAGIPYSSARRLWADPEFQAELSKARAEMFDSVIGRVRGMAGKALDVLERALDRGDQGAARYLLDRGLSLHDSDIEARLASLEARIK